MLRSNIKSLSVEGVGLKSLSDKRVRVSDKFLRLRLRPTRRSKASSANKNGKYTRQAGDGYEVLMYDGIRSTTIFSRTERGEITMTLAQTGSAGCPKSAAIHM